MKILFLVPYPLKESASQRFRFEQYFEVLTQRGYTYRVQSFLNSRNWQYFFTSGRILEKSLALIKGFCKRLLILFIIPAYDRIFIHREAAPIGPPLIEWIIAHIFKKKIIYDFDDAIWLTDRKDESLFLRISKWRSKIASICRLSHCVSTGNAYLCEFARIHTAKVVHNPTTIDTEFLHNPALYSTQNRSDKITITWTGSHSTLKYLNTIESAFQELEKKYTKLEFLIIADQKPTLSLKNLRFVPWSTATEITGLMESDIGVMPLPDDEWARGKCGFKALQYMALEIPTVVSPVGVNTFIVEHGENGFFCASQKEWIKYLEILICDKSVRERMGKKGRQKVIDQFSVGSNKDNFLSLFS